MSLPQLVSISSAPPSLHFGHKQAWRYQQDKNFDNLITKIQFSLSFDSLYFFL